MAITGFEIDFLPVGEKGDSGDAILVRFDHDGGIRNDGSQEIILVDGGFKDTANVIINHMIRHYETLQIDHMVCSHPDQDHIGGLEGVIKACNVGALWINRPRKYESWENLPNKSDGGFDQLHAAKVEQLIAVYEAKQKKFGLTIDIREPLLGKMIGPFVVCSPSLPFYKKLVRGELHREENINVDNENLYFYPKTSDRNESSTVLFAAPYGEERILLTADAGIKALEETLKCFDSVAQLPNLSFIQMPHHGGRSSVNANVLNMLLNKEKGCAYVSVAKQAMADKNNSHPRHSVSNAFYRRGYPCYVTNGKSLCYSVNMPARPGWVSATHLGFSSDSDPNRYEFLRRPLSVSR